VTLPKLWLPYAQMKTAPQPSIVVRTEGVRIHLADGTVLIDGIASWWTACHGYNHPRLSAAIADQLERVPHVMLGGLAHEPIMRLTERLAAVLPGDLSHSFFSESGSVAVEVAMKMAVQYWINGGRRGRHRFLSFKGAYHGDTFAAMSVCDPDDGMHALFRGILAEQSIVPLPRSDAELAVFEQHVAENASTLAGMIIEPLVQAAGGFLFHSPEILRRIVEIVRAYDLLVIFDEIATGFGRTGSLFACEQAGIVPDIVTLSKAMTGGMLPLAVTVARRHVFERFMSESVDDALMHGPTYAGNALACAAANASLDLFAAEPRLPQAGRIEAQLRRELEPCREYPGVADVRVKGAIGVVELTAVPAHDALRHRFVRRGCWIRPFGKVVYLMPALTITEDELGTLTRAIVAELHAV
jgi:adenosylmethionine---8-amino-7-oxononanoate aminotransferase